MSFFWPKPNLRPQTDAHRGETDAPEPLCVAKLIPDALQIDKLARRKWLIVGWGAAFSAKLWVAALRRDALLLQMRAETSREGRAERLFPGHSPLGLLPAAPFPIRKSRIFPALWKLSGGGPSAKRWAWRDAKHDNCHSSKSARPRIELLPHSCAAVLCGCSFGAKGSALGGSPELSRAELSRAELNRTEQTSD